jgi:hypothetical protein
MMQTLALKAGARADPISTPREAASAAVEEEI